MESGTKYQPIESGIIVTAIIVKDSLLTYRLVSKMT